jgi:hypothetical protein
MPLDSSDLPEISSQVSHHAVRESRRRFAVERIPKLVDCEADQ